MKAASHISQTLIALVLLLMTILISINTADKKPTSLSYSSIHQNPYFESSRQEKQHSSVLLAIEIEIDEEEEEDEEDNMNDAQFIIQASAIISQSDIPPVESHSKSSLRKKREIQFYFSGSSPPL